MVQAYSTSTTFAWNTAGVVPGVYRVSVWAKDANSTGTFGNALGRWDTYNSSLLFNVTTCSALSASAMPLSTAGVGTGVTITAQASGCPDASPVYEFWVLGPGSSTYQMAQGYSTSPTFSWNTTGLVPGTYRISVWTRDANSAGAFANGSGTWDLYNNRTLYSVTACTTVSDLPSRSSPAGVGAMITLTAHASGCPNPNTNYEFWVLAPGATAYQAVQPYSTTATYSWNTTGLIPGTYHVAVWARDASSGGGFSNSLGTFDASTSAAYTLTSCTAVSSTVAPSSPRAPGTPVKVTAHASGCPNPNPLYEFWVLAPGASTYQVGQAYSTSATFNWDTTGLAPGTYRIAVWVQDAASGGGSGSTAGRWDASNNSTLFKLS
jgi:hypothetical protein